MCLQRWQISQGSLHPLQDVNFLCRNKVLLIRIFLMHGQNSLEEKQHKHVLYKNGLPVEHGENVGKVRHKRPPRCLPKKKWRKPKNSGIRKKKRLKVRFEKIFILVDEIGTNSFLYWPLAQNPYCRGVFQPNCVSQNKIRKYTLLDVDFFSTKSILIFLRLSSEI